MCNYEESLKILNKTGELSIKDIEDIHNNFVEKLKNFAHLSTDSKEKDFVIIRKYLNAMNVVFCSRYTNSQMTPEEYEIWKLSLKEDFKDLPIDIKIELKNLFTTRIIQIIRTNILKGNDLYSYDDYKIEDIKDVKFNKTRIRYKYRFLIMLLFLITIILIALFVV